MVIQHLDYHGALRQDGIQLNVPDPIGVCHALIPPTMATQALR